MAWSHQDLYRDVERIRKLKVVESATVVGNSIQIVTAQWALRHSHSILPLAQYLIRIESGEYKPRLRYAHSIMGLIHRHPTLGGRIGLDEWNQEGCFGDYIDDLVSAHSQGPFMHTLAVLAMLQGIKADPCVNDEIIETLFALFSIAMMTVTVAAILRLTGIL